MKSCVDPSLPITKSHGVLSVGRYLDTKDFEQHIVIQSEFVEDGKLKTYKYELTGIVSDEKSWASIAGDPMLVKIRSFTKDVQIPEFFDCEFTLLHIPPENAQDNDITQRIKPGLMLDYSASTTTRKMVKNIIANARKDKTLINPCYPLLDKLFTLEQYAKKLDLKTHPYSLDAEKWNTFITEMNRVLPPEAINIKSRFFGHLSDTELYSLHVKFNQSKKENASEFLTNIRMHRTNFLNPSPDPKYAYFNKRCDIAQADIDALRSKFTKLNDSKLTAFRDRTIAERTSFEGVSCNLPTEALRALHAVILQSKSQNIGRHHFRNIIKNGKWLTHCGNWAKQMIVKIWPFIKKYKPAKEKLMPFVKSLATTPPSHSFPPTKKWPINTENGLGIPGLLSWPHGWGKRAWLSIRTVSAAGILLASVCLLGGVMAGLFGGPIGLLVGIISCATGGGIAALVGAVNIALLPYKTQALTLSGTTAVGLLLAGIGTALLLSGIAAIPGIIFIAAGGSISGLSFAALAISSVVALVTHIKKRNLLDPLDFSSIDQPSLEQLEKQLKEMPPATQQVEKSIEITKEPDNLPNDQKAKIY